MTALDRARRSDAVRNRDALLAAAAAAFAEHGLDVTVAEISARAGVGKGTFFRHFATKDDLVAAIVREHVDELNALGTQLLSAPHPEDALLEFVTIAAGRRQQREVEFLLRASESDPVLTQLLGSFAATVDALVTRAQESGHIRSDIDGADVILLMCAPTHIVGVLHDATPDLWKRYLGLIFDGLRPDGAHPLPAAPRGIR